MGNKRYEKLICQIVDIDPSFPVGFLQILFRNILLRHLCPIDFKMSVLKQECLFSTLTNFFFYKIIRSNLIICKLVT